MLFVADKEQKIEQIALIRSLKRRMNVTSELQGHGFFFKTPPPETGRINGYATPRFLALTMIEVAELVFAVDSASAAITITIDPCIVQFSNFFSILGLRASTFALAAILHRFTSLK